jgi:hypothetical protein
MTCSRIQTIQVSNNLQATNNELYGNIFGYGIFKKVVELVLNVW